MLVTLSWPALRRSRPYLLTQVQKPRSPHAPTAIWTSTTAHHNRQLIYKTVIIGVTIFFAVHLAWFGTLDVCKLGKVGIYIIGWFLRP
jgi:hypothetical protein